MNFTSKSNGMDLQSFQQLFDHYLSTYLVDKCNSVRQYFPDSTTYDMVTYLESYAQKGKRLRPYMVYVGYSLYGWQDTEWIMRVGCIHELIHLFALIHDDICDQGVTRHHIPTYHKHLETLYDDPAVGVAQGMLVGDLVYTRALQECSLLLADFPQAHQTIYTMLNEVVCGQMVDVHFSHETHQRSLEEIRHKDNLKSGQYSLAKPLLVGAILWWADEKSLETIKKLGYTMWLAFQMRDDLLDRIPNKEGKTPMSDIQEWNQTIVFAELLAVVDDPEKLWSLRNKVLDTSDYTLLSDLFVTHNIQATIHDRILTLLDECLVLLDAIDLPAWSADDLMSVINLLKTL